MRIYWIAGICLLASIADAQSTGTIRGTVSFEAGNVSAHDTTIHLSPLGRTVRTDDAGNFEIKDVPPGKYELVAHLHFFNDERKTIEVTSGAVAQINFQLKLATVRQEVTVTATGKEENILETF